MPEVTENNQQFIYLHLKSFNWGFFSKSVKSRPLLVRGKGRIYEDDLLPKPVRQKGKRDCFNQTSSKLKQKSFHF